MRGRTGAPICYSTLTFILGVTKAISIRRMLAVLFSFYQKWLLAVTAIPKDDSRLIAGQDVVVSARDCRAQLAICNFLYIPRLVTLQHPSRKSRLVLFGLDSKNAAEFAREFAFFDTRLFSYTQVVRLIENTNLISNSPRSPNLFFAIIGATREFCNN